MHIWKVLSALLYASWMLLDAEGWFLCAAVRFRDAPGRRGMVSALLYASGMLLDAAG